MSARIGDIERENDLIPKNKTADTQTNIIGSGNPVVVVNQDKKKKPFDVKFSKNEPKIKPNIKYSAKQSYRRYKSKTEPNLNSNIMVNEEDDIVKQIKKAFGINPENTNYSSVESAPFPVPDNFDNFQTPTDFAPVPSKGQKKFSDDIFLLSLLQDNGFMTQEEKHLMNEMSNDPKNQSLNEAQLTELANQFAKEIIDNREKNGETTFTRANIQKLKNLENMTYKQAKTYYDKLPDEEKLEIDNTPDIDDINTFTTVIKQKLFNSFLAGEEISDISKEVEEALIGLKITGPKRDDDSDEFEEVFEDIPSPSHTELSAKTTEPYGSSVGEITSVEEAKRKPGRPAKRPETIAKQQYEKTVKSFQLTKKKNIDKVFNLNKKERLEYSNEFHKYLLP